MLSIYHYEACLRASFCSVHCHCKLASVRSHRTSIHFFVEAYYFVIHIYSLLDLNCIVSFVLYRFSVSIQSYPCSAFFVPCRRIESNWICIVSSLRYGVVTILGSRTIRRIVLAFGSVDRNRSSGRRFLLKTMAYY